MNIYLLQVSTIFVVGQCTTHYKMLNFYVIWDLRWISILHWDAFILIFWNLTFNSHVIDFQKRFWVRGCYHAQWKFHNIYSKLYNDLKISWIQTKRICVLRDNRTMQATITPVCIAKLPFFNLVGVKNQ